MGDWTVWEVNDSGWKETEVLDWMHGFIGEMAEEIGTSALPIGNDYFDVFKINGRYISKEIQEEYERISAMDRYSTEYDDEIDEFIDKDEDRRWYYFFNQIYKKFYYVIFVTIGFDETGEEVLDGHTILCASFKNMLDTVRLLRELGNHSR